MDDQPDATPDTQMPSAQYPPFERDEDFESVYANNINFEASVWDLKLIFGLLDQSNNKQTVRQHTAISIPWVQAKLLLYFLEVNIGAYEADYGVIRVPAAVTPPVPIQPIETPDNEYVSSLFSYFAAKHRLLFGPHGSVAPPPRADAPK
jgi:hypothetical protein